MKSKLVRLLTPAPYWVKKPIFRLWLKLTRAGRVAAGGERLVVGSWDELLESEEFYHLMHAHRYWWASRRIASDAEVLDLGCGSGYGTWYLARASPSRHVLGFDLDEKALKWANEHFTTIDNVSFTDYPTMNLLVWPNVFDYVVCFEVVEHSPSSVLEAVKTWLAPTGTLLMSTANATPGAVRERLIEDRLVTPNPTHVKEFTAIEYGALLRSLFKEVELYGQCPVGVYSYEGYKKRRRTRTFLSDFEMRPDDFVNCEVLVAVCRGLRL